MENSEETLEQFIKKQRSIIETKIASLNPTEISFALNKIPKTNTMLEYRKFRADFLRVFNNPIEIPKSITYSDQLLSSPKTNIDFPKDQRQFLLEFFKNEIKRVKGIGKIVSSRIYSPKIAFDNQNEYSIFNDSVSRHLSACEEGLQRLTAQTLMTFNASDLFLEMTHYFFTKRRRAMFSSYLETIKLFPITNRKPIFNFLFDYVNSMFKKDTSQAPLPLQIISIQPLNDELIRLAHRFNLKPDLEKSDGQEFVYHANKTFQDMWINLNTFELPKKKVQFNEKPLHPSFIQLTQQSILSQAPRDFRIINIFDHVLNWTDDEVSMTIREVSQYYNTSISSQLATNERNRKLLPLHKISAWMELRYVHMKFLTCSILSLLNYFEFIKIRLYNKHKSFSCIHYNKIKVGHSSSLMSIIEISDENGPFLFQSSLKNFNDMKDQIIAIASFHIEKQQTSEGENQRIPDREAILEKVLECEFKFLNAKRKFIQALLEVLNHGKNQRIIEKILETMNELPVLNLPLFKSFEVPFNAAIELMERKAGLTRSLINLQVQHERQISSQFDDRINLFDNPLRLKASNYRMFDESIPISPFEVYESLTDISKFIDLIPRVVNELGESIDIRMSKFGVYLEIAVLKEIHELLCDTIQHGYFPFDRASSNFHFLLSDSVNSLFTSPYINNLSSIASLMENMNEGRKLRFMMSVRKFVKITWRLQKQIIKTNLLQTAYYSQCDVLGIAERTVLLSSFKENAKKELNDNQTTSSNDKIIDFALTEFETISINFSSKPTIKDILYVGNYDKLNEIMKFQTLQNVILEIAVRYNSHILDSDFILEFFDLNERKDKENEKDNEQEREEDDEDPSKFFLTEAEAEPENNNNNTTSNDDNSTKNDNETKDNNQSFFKQFIAAQLFTLSTALYRDNVAAYEDKSLLLVPIKILKSKARAILQTQFKVKPKMSHNELFELYTNEMIDSFSSFMYRSELVHITNLERQLLLSNSFVDTFIIGPDPTMCLINEAGRFEKFFYVPTWVECFRMLQSAPHQRQSTVLKPTLQFVLCRYQLLSLVRFESSLQIKASLVLDSLFENQFILETTVFQTLFNEFSRLSSGRETDIASGYLNDRLAYFFYRFENTIISAFESFNVSVNVEAKKMNINPDNEKNVKIRLGGVSDRTFGETIKNFWLQMHSPFDNNLMTIRRYIPLYQDEFLFNINEMDRNEIINQFTMTDSMIHEATTALKNNIFVDFFQLLPSLLEFLKSSIALNHLKFAYFLLLHNVPESEINLTSSVLLMNNEIYYEGLSAWNDTIVDQAMKSLVPRDETIHQLQDAPSITKIHNAYSEQIHFQIDLLLLSNQIKAIQNSIQKFQSDFSTSNEKKSLISYKPDFLVGSDILGKPVNDQLLVISPHDADTQFNQENVYSHAKFVNFVANALDDCTLERRDHDGTFSTIFDGDRFEEGCHKLTNTLDVFFNGSLNDMNMTWKQYVATLAEKMKQNMESIRSVDKIIEYTHNRFERQTECEIATKFADQIHQLNALNDQIHTLNQQRPKQDKEIESNLTVYFDKLVSDIGQEIEVKKSMFTGIKQKVYSGVINKIKEAKKVELTVDPNRMRMPLPETVQTVESEDSEPKDNSEQKIKNQQILNGLREENSVSRKYVLKLRIVRCLNEISMRMYFQKRLTAVENDRRQANAALFSNRLNYETQEVSMLKQLDGCRKRLTDTEIEVERLKQQLENEKMNNIQLVHWKAKNLKTVDELKEKLSHFKAVDVNVDELLTRLQERQAALDLLRAETDEIEKNFNDEVRAPMKEVERLREEMLKARKERAELFMAMKKEGDFNGDFDERLEKETKIRAILDENAQLKHDNALLKSQIDEMEFQKEKRARDMKSFMEKTTQPPPPTIRSSAKVPGAIIKPTVTGRSLSRI